MFAELNTYTAHFLLTRATLEYPAVRAALGGGGRILPPWLSPERSAVEKRDMRRSKALNMNFQMHPYFFKNWSQVCQGQNCVFRQCRLLRAEFSYKLCTNRSERFYIRLVQNGVPELTYECQDQGQVRSTMAIIQKNEDEEARDASCINHFRLILQQ